MKSANNRKLGLINTAGKGIKKRLAQYSRDTGQAQNAIRTN